MYNAVETIRQAINQQGLDAIVCSSPDNVTYSAGFMVPSHQRNRHRRVFSVITATGAAQMIVVTVEENITRTNSLIQPVVAYNEFSDDPVEILADFLDEKQANRRVAVELNQFPIRDFMRLRELIPHCEFSDADPLMLRLRRVKHAEEIEYIRRCCQIADEVYRMLQAEADSSMTEMDLYGMAIAKLAACGVEFPRMALGSGTRSGDANAKATEKRLHPGEIVRFDVLGTYHNFNLDIARTAVVGKPSDQQREEWKRLYEVHLRSIDRVHAGASTRDLYMRFNEDMSKIFGTRGTLNFLGHGLGLSVHEPPYFNAVSDTPLEENMVLCLEPMHLIPNVQGYHVEDCLVVKKNGCEVLSNLESGKELFEIQVQ